jgi:hypothetical protein
VCLDVDVIAAAAARDGSTYIFMSSKPKYLFFAQQDDPEQEFDVRSVPASCAHIVVTHPFLEASTPGLALSLPPSLKQQLFSRGAAGRNRS